ncbi:MAG: UvrD-helicase domain-containing protein [Myxococcales bacterium]|nr:UvrD-helicase domain-containing protein [Myxococcales bacterium]
MTTDPGLNPRQAQAAHHVEGPLVVFAGAGSGKTRVITHRVAHLVGTCGVKPWRILAVTFTNKAAAEMRERLSALVPGAAADLWVGTFHATCARLLRRYHEEAGVRRDFVIYDDTDQKAMVTRLMRELKLDERRFPPKQVAARINRAKQEGLGPTEVEGDDPLSRVSRDVYGHYQVKMDACGALDFGDLIYRVVRGMRDNPELQRALQERFEFVLVDEFQDTNHVQFELVARVCARHHNLCVVGDDDQSIYRWRGADRRNILDFRHHFSDATIVKLEQNYRSTQRILSVANAVVQRNVDREPKRLWTDNEEGTPVTIVSCSDERDEAQVLVKAMGMMLEAGYARNDVALLYRIHAQSRVFEEALRFANLPYRVVGGLRFYDRAEIKDLLAYLRLLQNPDDDVSLLRVINTPPRGIGKTTATRLLEAAARAGTSVWSALAVAADDPSHGPAARKKLGLFRELVAGFMAELEGGAGPATLAQTVLSETGYLELLQEEDSVEADARLENLKEAVGSMIEFERDSEEGTLSAFLELVTLQTDADRVDDDDAITLMTIHAAKGLEFPVVMVAGLEEQMFPRRGVAEDDDPEELEEERRLAYVAFTRAQERLLLSHAQVRRVYGELRFQTRSRFIDEIPSDEAHFVGQPSTAPATGSYRARQGPPTYSDRGADPAGRDANRFGGHRGGSVAGDSYVDRSEAADHPEGEEIYQGMRVRHRKFGVGSVQSVSEGLPPRVTVLFPGVGNKQILSRFLEPA